MKKYFKLFVLVIGMAFMFAKAHSQNHTTVRSIQLNNGNNGPSYIVNESGKLLPGFSRNAATQGPFFLRANTSIVNNNPSNEQNFVRTETIQVPGVTDDLGVTNLNTNQKTTSFEYVDGLGGKLQNVVKQGSPTYKDLVMPYKTDDFGRIPKDYLPYASIQADNGEYRPNWNAEQISFYAGTSKVPQDENPWAVKSFDDAPTNDVRNIYGPGKEWQTNAKFVQTLKKVETSGAILKWKYISEGIAPEISTYPANSIVYTEKQDEDMIVSKQYTDFRGQVLLSIADANGIAAKTYNVYDISGRLRIVVPPAAVDKLATEYQPGGISAQDKMKFINRWCFQYVYDDLGRIVKKRSPGMDDWAMMVYDKWDRLVLTREPGWTANEWMFTKYDDLNRPILTGVYSTSSTHDALQASATSSVSRFETLSGYTYTLTQSFPIVNESDLRLVTYYDNYGFKISGWDSESNDFSFVPETGFAGSFFSSVRGQVTGTKIRVLGTSRWLNIVKYYDNKYRNIQTISENHKSGVDRTSNKYDFIRLVQTLQVHSSSSQSSLQVLKTAAYDNGRLVSITHKVGANAPVILTSNKYNEVGQLIEKNLHSTDLGNTFLQSVDYTHNIRGSIANINNSTLTISGNNDDSNDLFGMDLLYNQQETINGTTITGRFNGNVSAIRWKTNNLKETPVEKIFNFNYDGLNRLAFNRYAEKLSGSWSGALDMFTENMSYDKNGNIISLNRNTRRGISATSPTTVDDLEYKYGDATTIDNGGNRLTNVHDATAFYNIADANPANGFTELVHNNFLTEYRYDESGRMISDDNREITEITYNYLNLPETIKLLNNRQIEYTYDAAGSKLSCIVKQNGSALYSTEYVGPFVYINGQLIFISTDEGRVVKNASGNFEYEYFLKDHQGNTRVVFGSKHETKSYLATLEDPLALQEEYDYNTNPDGFKNISNSRSGFFNHSPANHQVVSPNRSAEARGNSTLAIGPAKMLQVSAGDRIQLEVFARYNELPSDASSLVTGLTSLISGSFGLSAGETAYSGFANYAPAQLGTIPGSGTLSKAYVCYILFNSSYTSAQIGYKSITSAAASQHERLFIDAVMPSSGYVYAFVANENTTSSVFFDDFLIVHEKNNNALQVLQSSDYYPFGLSFNEYYQQRLNLSENTYYPQNKYQFQSQERVTGFDLGWYQFKYRMHDPAIGRFGMVDPLADKYTYNSTYAFSENQLVGHVELEGLETQIATQVASYWATVKVIAESKNYDPSWMDYLKTAALIQFNSSQAGQGFSNIYWGSGTASVEVGNYALYRGERMYDAIQANPGVQIEDLGAMLDKEHNKIVRDGVNQAYRGYAQVQMWSSNASLSFFSAGLSLDKVGLSNSGELFRGKVTGPGDLVSVAYGIEIPTTLNATRAAHRNFGNSSFFKALSTDARFSAGMDDLFGYDLKAYMKGGKSSLLNPRGYEWHHQDNYLWLLERNVHRNPTFQDFLHPYPNGGGAWSQIYSGR